MMNSDSGLRTDGYYCTGPAPWEEWHAGVRMHGIRYHFIRFYANGDWLGCCRDHGFDFWHFTEQVTEELFAAAKRDCAPRIGDEDPLCTAGVYTIEDGHVLRKLVASWAGRFEWTFYYRLTRDGLVQVDKDALAQCKARKAGRAEVFETVTESFGTSTEQEQQGHAWSFEPRNKAPG
jgi:hypothetical protein